VWDGEDFWDGRTDFSYPLGDFSPATRLDLCEGFEDTKVDLPRKGKGRRELLNLECSINYDSKGASSRRGKGKAHAF
jgi:hypothetical protein